MADVWYTAAQMFVCVSARASTYLCVLVHVHFLGQINGDRKRNNIQADNISSDLKLLPCSGYYFLHIFRVYVFKIQKNSAEN